MPIVPRVTKLGTSCYTLTLRATSLLPAVLRVIDTNAGVPFVTGQTLKLTPGTHDYTISLIRNLFRSGSSDDVQLWTSGNNTLTLLDAQVPVNCAVAVDEIVTQAKAARATAAVATGSLDAAPVAQNGGLASTGVKTLAIGGIGVGLLASGGIILYGARGRRPSRTH